MPISHIPHDGWVLVCDGRKALILNNQGTALNPKFETRTQLKSDINPATHHQGTDAPGRVISSATGRRAAVDQTDFHDRAEQAFASKTATTINTLCQKGQIKNLTVVAPPRTLAHLRASYSNATKACIAAEHDRDLTKHPIGEIERLLTAE